MSFGCWCHRCSQLGAPCLVDLFAICATFASRNPGKTRDREWEWERKRRSGEDSVGCLVFASLAVLQCSADVCAPDWLVENWTENCWKKMKMKMKMERKATQHCLFPDEYSKTPLPPPDTDDLMYELMCTPIIRRFSKLVCLSVGFCVCICPCLVLYVCVYFADW